MISTFFLPQHWQPPLSLTSWRLCCTFGHEEYFYLVTISSTTYFFMTEPFPPPVILKSKMTFPFHNQALSQSHWMSVTPCHPLCGIDDFSLSSVSTWKTVHGQKIRIYNIYINYNINKFNNIEWLHSKWLYLTSYLSLSKGEISHFPWLRVDWGLKKNYLLIDLSQYLSTLSFWHSVIWRFNLHFAVTQSQSRLICLHWNYLKLKLLHTIKCLLQNSARRLIWD